MLRLSHWAQANYWTARLLLVGLHVLLVMVAIRMGLALDLAGVSIPASAPLFTLAIPLMGWAAYRQLALPSRGTWRQRKWVEGLILTGCVLTIALLAARLVDGPESAAPGGGITPAAQFTALVHPDQAQSDEVLAPQELTGQAKRTWRRALRAKAKTYLRTQQRRIDGVGAFFLILLTVLVASFLELLVLALACSISCGGGSEVLVLLVVVLGTAGVILLGILGISAIVRAIQRSKDPDNPQIRRKRSPRKKILE
jgi:hypothetical protein